MMEEVQEVDGIITDVEQTHTKEQAHITKQ